MVADEETSQSSASDLMKMFWYIKGNGVEGFLGYKLGAELKKKKQGNHQ